MDKIVDFLWTALRLKLLKRSGWIESGILDAESVADHSFGVGVISVALSSSERDCFDLNRCIALSFIHDLAEAIIGDITPSDNIDIKNKLENEKSVMIKLSDKLSSTYLLELWDEFSKGESIEARLVRDADALDMAIQSILYERSKQLASTTTDRFLLSAYKNIKTDKGKEFFDFLTTHRYAR